MNPFETTTEELQRAGEEALGIVTRYWESIPARRVVPDVTPRQMAQLFEEPVPELGMPLLELVREVGNKVERNATAMGHPRYFAFVNPGSTSVAPLAEAMAAMFNQNLGAWRNSPSGTAIELQVVKWMAELLGMPVGSGGILVSGGSMASLTGLAAALRAKAPWDVRRLGLQGGAGPLTFYASEEVHRCVVKAADLLGVGEEYVRLVPVDSDYRMDLRGLARRVDADRKIGAIPIAVIGSAGTVNSGAVDRLGEIADFAAAENIWYHVDGAYGALAALAPTGRQLLQGMERADSIALDPHKWLFCPYEAGLCLVRDPEILKRSFGGAAAYMKEDKEAAPGEGHRTDLFEYGPQLSRGFRALKVWMSLKAHGRRAYADAIEEHLRLARLLDQKVLEHPRFELASRAQMSISCFRWIPEGLQPDPETMDRLQDRITLGLEKSGEGLMSGTRLSGRAVLRACILSFRTRESDLEGLLESLDRIGHETWKEMK